MSSAATMVDLGATKGGARETRVASSRVCDAVVGRGCFDAARPQAGSRGVLGRCVCPGARVDHCLVDVRAPSQVGLAGPELDAIGVEIVDASALESVDSLRAPDAARRCGQHRHRDGRAPTTQQAVQAASAAPQRSEGAPPTAPIRAEPEPDAAPKIRLPQSPPMPGTVLPSRPRPRWRSRSPRQIRRRSRNMGVTTRACRSSTRSSQGVRHRGQPKPRPHRALPQPRDPASSRASPCWCEPRSAGPARGTSEHGAGFTSPSCCRTPAHWCPPRSQGQVRTLGWTRPPCKPFGPRRSPVRPPERRKRSGHSSCRSISSNRPTIVLLDAGKQNQIKYDRVSQLHPSVQLDAAEQAHVAPGSSTSSFLNETWLRTSSLSRLSPLMPTVNSGT